MRNKSPNAWWLKTTIHLFNVASNQLKVSWSRLGSEELLYYSVCFLCFSFDQWVSRACVFHRDSRVSREKKNRNLWELAKLYCPVLYIWFRSVQLSRSDVSDSLWPRGQQHTKLPCPSPTPGAYSNSCPLSQWCHPTISSSAIPFSSCPQSFPASGSSQMSPFFASGGQSIGVLASASVLPMNTQDWFPLGWTGWISLQSKGLSRVFSTVQKHQFFGTQLSS